MVSWIKRNPVALLIVLFVVLVVLEDVGLLPHLLVVILACLGALAVVLSLGRRPRSPVLTKVLKLIDDEIFWSMEAEHHSSQAHDGETELHNAEVGALKRLREKVEKEIPS